MKFWYKKPFSHCICHKMWSLKTKMRPFNLKMRSFKHKMRCFKHKMRPFKTAQMPQFRPSLVFSPLFSLKNMVGNG